ncbi:MAG: DUF2628 domain-containing protein [Candidatus Anstonellales archaeon]
MKKLLVYENDILNKIEFVKEGFNWPLFFFGFAWLLYKRFWSMAVIYYLINPITIGVIEYSIKDKDISTIVGLVLAIIFSTVMGMYGNKLYRDHLESKGFKLICYVHASGIDEAVYKLVRLYKDKQSV